MTYLDVWRSGTFLLYSCKRLSESKKRRQDCLMSSAQSFYGLCLRSVAHLLTCQGRRQLCKSGGANTLPKAVHRGTYAENFFRLHFQLSGWALVAPSFFALHASSRCTRIDAADRRRTVLATFVWCTLFSGMGAQSAKRSTKIKNARGVLKYTCKHVAVALAGETYFNVWWSARLP